MRSANPARRELRVGPRTDGERWPGDAQWLHLTLADGERARWRVESVREDRGEWVVTVAAGVTRDNVARARKAVVMVEAAEVEAAERRANGWVGFIVEDGSGHCVGTVSDEYNTGAHDVIEVARSDGGTLILPVIDQTIDRVDVARGVLVLGDVAPYAVEYVKGKR